ncbi:MAG: hypothetical protein QOI91_2682 [Solirubrobacteraceae bacterium]|nr:hypothetical protein [Solirubrobacteraceae bacterium]
MRRSASTLVLLAALAAWAPAAGAATLTLDRGCYLSKQPALPNGQTIAVRGAGFTPGAQVSFTLGSASLGAIPADAAGNVAGQFQPPSLGGAGSFRDTRILIATDGTNQGTAPVPLRRVAADFLPAAGRPSTHRVNFYVYGFGPLLTAQRRSTNQPVYEHVFDPAGKLRATFRVGRTSGPCGDLKTTRRRVLPFAHPANGRWSFIFTTKPRYSRRSIPGAGVGYQVTTVFRPR